MAKSCCLCGSSVEDPLNLGELKQCKNYYAHYYCLLLSSTIKQSGGDDEGILGFLHSDISQELKLSRKRVCTYCCQRGASVLCCHRNCKVMFHLPCGLQQKSLHEFHGHFNSHCFSHRPKQKFVKPKEPCTCTVCLEVIDLEIWTEVLWAPCCKKKSFFHKKCLQQMALSAGYFFKCPICNDTDIFQRSMRTFGVFVPERDASWELEPNAYEELMIRHEECNAEICKCPRGRKYSCSGSWLIVLCCRCGSQGTHVACNKLKRGQTWCCSVCKFPSSNTSLSNSQETTLKTACNSTSDGSSSISSITSCLSSSLSSTSSSLTSISSINISSLNSLSQPSTSSYLASLSTKNLPFSLSNASFGEMTYSRNTNSNIPSNSDLVQIIDDIDSSTLWAGNTSNESKSTISQSSQNSISKPRKRRRTTIEIDKNEEERPSTSRTSKISSETTVIESDSDSDVMVIEEEPTVKRLVANDGSVLSIQPISEHSHNFSVQGDLNIAQQPDPTDTLMNLVISNVRSLSENDDPATNLQQNHSRVRMMPSQNINQNAQARINPPASNLILHVPQNGESENGGKSLSIFDVEGNEFILQEIVGFQVISGKRTKEDQNKQNVGTVQENEVVVID